MSSYSSVTRSPEPSLFHSLVVQDDRDSQFGAVPLRNPFHADSAMSTMFELDSLPDRPLTAEELQSLRESDAVVEAAPLARAEDGIRHLALQAGERLYGLGYRDDEGWVVVEDRIAEDTDDLAAVRNALRGWAEE